MLLLIKYYYSLVVLYVVYELGWEKKKVYVEKMPQHDPQCQRQNSTQKNLAENEKHQREKGFTEPRYIRVFGRI